MLKLLITDQSDNPLPGVNILITGTNEGTVTDISGKAVLSDLPDEEVKIKISYVGYEDEVLEFHFPRVDNSEIKVELREEKEYLDEITIESVRSSRTIEDIPTRVELITEDELGEKAAMNSANIGMLLSETTGVRIQNTSLSSGNLSIRIQGLDGRYTQILKDGFPIYGGFAGGLSIMQIPPLDLKQVELIKGSNSTLYGGGAIAGLVNLISIRPSVDPELSVMIDQTTALGTTGNIFYAQRYQKTGITFYGTVDNQPEFDPDKDGFSNLPKSRTININPKFFIYPDSDTEISIGINATTDRRIGGDMGVIREEVPHQNLFTENNNSERITGMVDYVSKVGRFDLSFKGSINYFDRELEVPDYLFSAEQLSGFSEFMINRSTHEISDWQAGLNYYSEDFNELNTDSLQARSYDFYTLGGFLQNTTSISRSFVVESGLRMDYNFEYGTFLLPRISLLYKPVKQLTSRLGGAMGYKLPTIFTEEAEQLYYKDIQPIDHNTVSPERSLGANFDLNYRTSISGKGTFSINQLFYITRLKNSLILTEISSGNNFEFENADGDLLSTGFETNLKFTYLDFVLYSNYAFVNTRLLYESDDPQKPLTPRHNAGFVIMYEKEEKWSVGYELYFTGSQFDNSYDKKPSYWVMGFMMMRMFDKLSLYINFENFTNTIQSDFEPLVIPDGIYPEFTDIWAPVEGFICNAGLKYRFIGSND